MTEVDTLGKTRYNNSKNSFCAYKHLSQDQTASHTSAVLENTAVWGGY